MVLERGLRLKCSNKLKFPFNIIQLRGCVSFYIYHSGMGFYYIVFMGRNLENMKKLTLVRIMDNVSLNDKHVVKKWRYF